MGDAQTACTDCPVDQYQTETGRTTCVSCPANSGAQFRMGACAGSCGGSSPCTLHPSPYTLHPTPDTPHSTPYTLHPIPCPLHPTPQTPHPKLTPQPLPRVSEDLGPQEFPEISPFPPTGLSRKPTVCACRDSRASGSRRTSASPSSSTPLRCCVALCCFYIVCNEMVPVWAAVLGQWLQCRASGSNDRVYTDIPEAAFVTLTPRDE